LAEQASTIAPVRSALSKPVRSTVGRSCTGSCGVRDLRRLLYILDYRGDLRYFYLVRARSWSASAADRSGPEFTDPTRG